MRGQRLRELDAAFASQPVDPGWATGAELALMRATAAPELALVQRPPTQVLADCRRSACRVQARFTDATELDTWLQAYLLVAVDTIGRSESVQSRAPGGESVVTIYGVRP